MGLYKLKNINEFIAEKFSTGSIGSAYSLIQSYLEKKLGAMLYPYPEEENFSKSDGTSGVGKRFFTDDGKSIRLNIERGASSEVVSIDYWDGSSTEPTWTIETGGESVAQYLPEVASALINPSAYLGDDDDDRLEEKAITDTTIKKILRLSKTMNAKEIASELDVSVKGVRSVLRDGKPGSGGRVRVKKASKEKRSEPQSEIDMIFAGDAALKDKAKLLDEIMEDIASVVRAVALGNVNGLMISGKAGTGKTHTVTAALKKNKARFVVVSGSASTPGIMMELYKNNGGIIVFDDCDSVFDDQESRNIFKAALDTKRVRTISYKKQNPNFYDPDKVRDPDQLAEFEEAGRIPNTFEFDGRVIFISNLKKEKLDPDGAIRSRSIIIDVSPDDMTIMERMRLMLKDIEPMDMPLKEKQEVFEYIKKSKNVSMRTFVKAANFKKTGIKNWQRILERYV
jgi:hypothetical protein